MNNFKENDWVNLKSELQIEDYDHLPLKILTIYPNGDISLGRNGSILTTIVYNLDDYIPWEPKENNWVIEKPKHPTMDGYHTFRIIKYRNILKHSSHIYEPFIGELPSFIKE